MKMTAWQVTLSGWLVFIIGHSIAVAIRALLLGASRRSGGGTSLLNAGFCAFDGALVVFAGILIAMGTVRLTNRKGWGALATLAVVSLQFLAAYGLYGLLAIVVHVGVGGSM